MRFSRFGYWGAQAAAVGAMAIALALTALLPPDLHLLKAGILAITLVVTFTIGLSSYRSADEVILQTHKTAWFWGSFCGLIVAALVTIAVLAHVVALPSFQAASQQSPEQNFASGVVLVVLAQAAGFITFWIIARRR
jgi:hypothetical protein